MSDESEPEQTIDYNNILYEETKGEDIDYYSDTLPHFNFYLKFQDTTFLKNLCKLEESEWRTNVKEREKQRLEETEEANQTDMICEMKTSEVQTNAIKDSSKDLLEDVGFFIEEEEEIEEEKEESKNETTKLKEINENGKTKETQIPIDIYTCIMNAIKNESFYLDEHEEYTKQMNQFFQRNKEQFIFSIERNMEDDNKQMCSKCFLCNEKKKGIKTLQDINIRVCKECKELDTNFRMISYSKLINKYCLHPQDLVKYEKQLAVCLTNNPRGYAKQMKLFYIFQIKEIAIRKHGSLNNVKQLYHSKILKTHKPRTSKKAIHKLKKPKSIFSKEKEESDKLRIICEENEHSFHSPICINENDNLYQKKCKNCNFYVEYIQF